MDQTGLYVLEDIIVDLKKQGKNILFVDVLKQPLYMMERIRMIPQLIAKEHIFENFDDCLRWIKKHTDK